MPVRLDAELGALCSLVEPTRRRVYAYAVRRRETTRESAARALGIGRALAAFHLDRLVEVGLLEASTGLGRTGRPVGRPAKLYRPADREILLAVPPRRYDFLAELLAEALASGQRRLDAARDRARRLGQEIGRQARSEVVAEGAARAGVVRDALLETFGYAPRSLDGGPIVFENCPFDRIARRYEPVVCPLNEAIVEGMLDGAREPDAVIRSAATPGGCCVAVHPAATPAS